MPPRRAAWTQVREDYLTCRLFNHTWERIPPPPPMGKRYLSGHRITLACTRCNTLREEVWSSANGDLLQRRYSYPEGYKYELPEDELAPARPDLRSEWIKRGYTVKVPRGLVRREAG